MEPSGSEYGCAARIARQSRRHRPVEASTDRLDQASQLTIIDAETVADDRLLLRGLGHIDWTTRNVALLRRMYRGHAINFSLRPRLVLVAPQFSHLIQSVAHQITHVQVDLMRYHSVELAAGSGLLFERL